MGTTKCCWTEQKKPTTGSTKAKEAKKEAVKKRPAPQPPTVNDSSSEKRKSETSFHTLDPVLPVVLKETTDGGRHNHEDLTDLTGMGKPPPTTSQFSQPVSLQDNQNNITYAKIDKSKKGQCRAKLIFYYYL